MSKNIPTIEISLDGYAFKKLLGVSLIERNVRFLNAFGFKEINFNCDENLIGYLTDFISYDFFLNRESWSFSINSIQNSTFSLNSNDIFDYAGIESDKSEENIFDRMNNRKIDTIKSKKDMRNASRLLFKLVDKPKAESIFIFTNVINRPLGKFFTYLIINLNITPNFISFFALVLAMLGSVLIMSGDYYLSLVAIILIQLSASLDCTDGPVAKLKYLSSSFGGWLDSVFDKISKLVLYVAIGVGLYNVNNNEMYLYFSMALLLGNSMTHLVDFMYKLHFNSFLSGYSVISHKVRIRNILNSDLNILGFACIALAFKLQAIYLLVLMIYFNILWISKIFIKYINHKSQITNHKS